MNSKTPNGSVAWRSFRDGYLAGLEDRIELDRIDLLFAVYSIVKPLAAADDGSLVVMYGVISQGQFGSPVFAYLFIGNAFYQYVGMVMVGVSGPLWMTVSIIAPSNIYTYPRSVFHSTF